MQSEDVFLQIVDKLINENDQLTEGKMMSSPAIKLNDKVIAFYHSDTMTFKFGKETELYKAQYSDSSYLSPFKNKPPLKGWLSVPSEFHKDWLKLTKECIVIHS